MNEVNWTALRSALCALVVTFLSTEIFGQTVSLITANGGNSFCEGETLEIFPQVNGFAPFFTYTWTLGSLGPNESGTSDDLSSIAVPLFNPGNFTVSLEVNDGLNVVSESFDFSVIPLVFGQLSLANTGLDYAQINQPGGNTLFRFCGGVENATMDFNLSYDGPVNFTDMFINLDWGDGTFAAPSELQGSSVSHTYAPGSYTIDFLVINPNPVTGSDCVSMQSYDVYVGSAPSITVTSTGEELCLPDAFHDIQIEGNGTEVDYALYYTDDTPGVFFTTSQDVTETHVFTQTSCGEVVDGEFFQLQDAFSATLIASNACSAFGIPTVFEIQPIVVSRGPDLEISSNVGSAVCPNSDVTLTNTSTPPELVAEGGCTDDYAFYWELDPSLTLVSGNLGSNNGALGNAFDPGAWTVGDASIVVSSNVEGSFVVTLVAGTECGLVSTDFAMEVLTPGNLSLDLPNQELCSGQTSQPFSFNVTPLDYLIQWVVLDEDGNEANPGDIEGVSPVSGSGLGSVTIPGWTLFNTGDQDFVFSVQAEVPCPTSNPLAHTITVHPEPVITALPSDTLICSGQSADIQLEVNTGDILIWDYFQGADITGATNDGHEYFMDDVLVNSGTAVDSVVYTITAKNPACPGDPAVVTVHVLPGVPSLNLDDAVLCPGETGDAVVFPTADMLVWTWENTEPLTGLAESGLGNISPWVASENTTDAPIEGVVTVTGQVDGCDPVEAGSYNVTVNPEATIVASPQASTICSGESAGVILEINTGDPLEWTALANPSVSGAMDGSGLEIQDVLTNTGTSASTVEYTVTALNPTCPGDDVIVAVEVLPGVPTQQLGDVFLCPGELAQAVVFDDVDGLVWSWTNTEPATGLASDGIGDIPSWTATNEGVVDLTGTVIVTGQVGTCDPEEAGTYQATVYPIPQAEITVSPDGNLSCVDGTANISLNFLTTGSSALNFSGPGVIDQGVDFATVDSAGTYTVDLESNNGCEASQLFEVNPIDDIAITQVNSSNPLCDGEASGVIDVQTDEDDGELTWEWTGTNAVTSLAQDLIAGTYFVVVTNAAECQDSAEVTLINPAPLSVALLDSVVSECGEGNGFLLVAASGGVGSLEYNWNPGGSDPLLDGIDAGDYSLVVQDANGCELDTTFTMVCLELVPPTPNEFISPNGDGLNEVWIIDNILYYTDATVQVYNRWGVEVYRAEPPYLNDWDGTNNQGEVLPSATYFYVIDTKKKSQKPFKGFLELQTEKP